MLVGINLLREGLDIPEVSLVAILDADKEGFLRSGRSLIQTIGRAARNLNGKAILYADRITDSMTGRSARPSAAAQRQVAFNLEHGITPRSVMKEVRDLIDGVYNPKGAKDDLKAAQAAAQVEAMSEKDLGKRVKQLEQPDARACAQPRVREGGAGARPAGAAARAGVRRQRRRPHPAAGARPGLSGDASCESARRTAGSAAACAQNAASSASSVSDGLVGGHHAAVGVFAGRGHAGVELAPGDDAARRGVDHHGAQRQPHPARLDDEFVLQTDQLGVQSQARPLAAVGARSTARNAPLRSIAWAISGASISAGVSTHSW